MASSVLPHPPTRVSRTADALLSLVSGISSYHSRAAFGQSLNEAQPFLSEDERMALHFIHKGLFRLFAFDPERDQEHQITPRHAL